MNRVLLTGATGQVGTAILKLAPENMQMHCASRDPSGLAAHALYPADLSIPAEVQSLLKQVQPAIIINAAAWTDVDGAEQYPEAAHRLNADLVQLLADYADKNKALLVHYSTDYVFAGDHLSAYLEPDSTKPKTVYGRTKLAGEQVLRASSATSLTFRTSWVYGGPTGNFLDTIRRKLIAGDVLKVVDDQIGCATWSRDIAACTWCALVQHSVHDSFSSDLYHLAGADSGSWYEFACRIESQLGLQGLLSYDPNAASRVSPCSSAEYSRPAPRPINSVLNCDKFDTMFGQRPAGWASVDQCLQELIAQ